MGMFRIRDSPNLLDAVQLVRILGIRDELVDKPGDEDTSEKSAVIRLPRVVLSVMTSSC